MGKEQQTVLIVDDEPLNIQMLGQWLSPFCRVLTAIDADHALKVCETQLPDLILLDIVMPGTDGYELCKQLKNNPITINIPIIFISGKDSVEDEARGLELGAVDYITKPFAKAIALARIKNQLTLKKKTDLLEQLISIDGLTEIPNRRYLDQHYPQEWRRMQRNNLPLSVFMIDIDVFKKFNDYYGHGEGDECLKKVAGILAECTKRGGEFVARYGGEEFAVILPDCTIEDAEMLAQKMIDKIRQAHIPHEVSEVDNKVTISIGITTQVPEKDSTPQTLLKSADEQLYMAKENGRNQYCSALIISE